MITYQEESFKDCFDDMLPLLVEHWEEVAIYKDKVRLEIDQERYQMMDDLGLLHIVTARDDGVLIGYYVSFLNRHLHYSKTLYALNDVLFLDIPYRKQGVAKEMFKYAEDRLKERGVDVIVIHMKTDHPFKSLCTGLGFDKVEYNYSKYIGE